jgi:hypothetical protein
VFGGSVMCESAEMIGLAMATFPRCQSFDRSP